MFMVYCLMEFFCGFYKIIFKIDENVWFCLDMMVVIFKCVDLMKINLFICVNDFKSMKKCRFCEEFLYFLLILVKVEKVLFCFLF